MERGAARAARAPRFISISCPPLLIDGSTIASRCADGTVVATVEAAAAAAAASAGPVILLLSALLALLDSDDLRGRVSSVAGLHSMGTLGLLDLLFLRFFGSRVMRGLLLVMTTLGGGVSELLSGNGRGLKWGEGRRPLLPRSSKLVAVQAVRQR